MPNPLMEGLAISREPEPLTIIIFGATGDLTHRKLLPALHSLYVRQHVSALRVVGVGRTRWTSEQFRNRAEAALGAAGARDGFLGNLEYRSIAYEDPQAYRALAELAPPNLLFYLATPPDAYPTVIDNLGRAGLADERSGFRRIVIEKPIGRDLATATALNQRLAGVFRESQVYRIDHYLGKETVQNLMVLRFGNSILEPIWNNRYVEHVQITVAEDIGIEGRARYYDRAGALRDMVQNHLLQLLCLVAMEPPIDLAADTIRDEKQKVLRALQPITAESVGRDIVRAQYTRGILAGEEVPGYLEEPDVHPDSRTETYVALRLQLDSWRWSGVPFLLRTGKRLARKASEIAVFFRDPPHILFGEGGPPRPNSLIVHVQPDEGVTFNLNSKVPGFTTEMNTVSLRFSYGTSFGEDSPEAYERLLLDCMIGDATLFIRADQVEASWRFVGRILELWDEFDPPLATYRAGSQGPAEAAGLCQGLRTRWRKI